MHSSQIFNRFVLYAVLLLFMVGLSSCRSPAKEETAAVEKSALSALLEKEQKEQKKQKIVFEEPNLPQPHDARLDGREGVAPCETKPVPVDRKPKVAIIIDDMGYHQKIGNSLLALDMNLTFSFLPKAPFTLEQEEQAWQQGRDILVHMPMEARDSAWDPGPGGLYLKFTPQEIRTTVTENLAAVPHAIGSNNHMGSRFTENRAAMHEVLSVLKQRGLFFIDSYTTAQSTGLDEAGKMAIPTARRHVFLDNVQEQDKICRQLEQLVALAKKNGWAIGIGHPNQATLEALTRCRDRLLKNVDIVSVHTLVK